MNPAAPPAYQTQNAAPGASLSEAVQAAHDEGQEFGGSVARDAPALWLEAVLARKPRMPSDLEARLLQGSALPIDFLLHDEVRHALRRGFWDALERTRRLAALKGKTSGLSTAAMGRVDNVVALSGELFDAIEVNAARTGNHKRAAVRMSRLAVQATAGSMSRAEAHMRAGEQWLLADESTEAVEQFQKAIADGGPTFDNPRVSLARAMFALGRTEDADALLREVRESGARTKPRTCDLVAELLTEQGDLAAALDWATAGVDACLAGDDRDELQLLLRLRYRLRVDLGLPEDDYDKLLDNKKAGPAAGK